MINDLYERDSTFKLKVFGEGTWWIVSLTVPTANEKPDCVVNHPRKRVGFRTEKGLEVEKYDSLNELVWDIKEEGKKYNVKFTKYKVVQNTVEEGGSVVEKSKISRRIEVQEKNIDKIMRIICDSNDSYPVTGFIYGNTFTLNSD